MYKFISVCTIMVFIVSSIFFSGLLIGTYRSVGYSKEELDAGLTKILTPMLSDLDTLKRKVFPEAIKLSEDNNNCPVDIKTMKCVEKK